MNDVDYLLQYKLEILPFEEKLDIKHLCAHQPRDIVTI